MPLPKVVCVIDADPAVRDGIAYLCQSGGHLARGYATGSAFLRDIDHLAPRCIICDESLPDTSGILLYQEVRGRGLDVPFALLISRATPIELVAASRAGIEFLWPKPLTDQGPLQKMLGLRA